MTDYQIACQQHDGSWTLRNFEAEDDPNAISFALSIRGDQRGELFRDDYWLASFDGTPECDAQRDPHSNENNVRHDVPMETEVAYFHRRALEEREWARISKTSAAKSAHLLIAVNLEGLARAVRAEWKRLSLYDVNAFRPGDVSSDQFSLSADKSSDRIV